MKKPNFGNLLKRRTRSYSAQAAITSVGIHLLLIFFAGSIVAVHYVQKKNAELIASTERRPRLERQKLQAPVKVEQLQKRALTSKLVSKKVSFANPEFILPDTGRISSLKTQKTSLPGIDTGRILKNLARTPGVGPSRINFFGIRAEGEKVCFVIDASDAMLADATGGLQTYEYIKSELNRIVSEMKPAMLFNLIFYDQQHVFMFRPNLVPATKDLAAELNVWMNDVNSDPEHPGLSEDQNNYQPSVVYDTALGADAQSWVLAIQSALEQQPDVVLTLGSGWGHHHISAEKATRLLDYAMWELLAGNIISGAQVLEPDRKLRNDLLKQASDAIEAEEALRTAANQPERFVRDVAQYVEYSSDQIMDHLEAVCMKTYTDQGLSRPYVDFVCLAEEGSQVVAGGTLNYLRTMTARYNGQFGFFRRESAEERRTTAENSSDQIAESAVNVSESSGKTPVRFFGVLTQKEGSRVAFILDVSAAMLTDETGGGFSYGYIKKQIEKSVAELKNGALFNVFLYDGRRIAQFRSDMAPVDPETLAALAAWLAPVNSDPSHLGIPEGIVADFPVKDYGTTLGTDVSGWLLAVQAAAQQKADMVMVSGTGWERLPVNKDKGRKLLDFSVWDTWSGGNEVAAGGEESTETGEDGTEVVTTSSGGAGAAALGTLAGLKEDKKQRDLLLKEALKAIEQEDKIRKSKGLPQPFVRDILSYLCYTAPQINEHLSTVVQEEFAESGKTPSISFFCLQPSAGKPSVETMRNLRKLTTDYNGAVTLFQGAGSAAQIKQLNRSLDLPE